MKGNEGLLILLNSRWKWKFTHAGGTKTSVEPPIRLIYGRFEGLIFAKWLIYGTQIAISQVWGAELQRSYSQYSGFGAIYKSLSETRTPESAIHKRNSSQQRPIRSRYHSNSRPAAPYNPIPNLFPGPTPGIPQDPAPTYRISRSALSSELDRIWRFLSENGEEDRPVPPESDKISLILSEKREAEEEHRSAPPRLPRNQTETEDFCLKMRRRKKKTPDLPEIGQKRADSV